MKLFKSFVLILIAGTALSLSPKTPDHICAGFFPENDLEIPVSQPSIFFGRNQQAGGVTEQEFNAVIDRLERLYREPIREKGGNLVINRLWIRGAVNANAERDDNNNWIVNMYGGLARHPKMTPDGLAMVLCHEIGHHIGGAVKIPVLKKWATNEGGSDYFAVTKCIRKYFAEDSDNRAQLKTAQLEVKAIESCRNQFDNDPDRLICARTMLAGRALSYVLQQMNMSFTTPRFSTPDKKQALMTAMGHPNAQCRMDTYYNGALCTVDKDVELDDNDYHIGSCTAKTHTSGFRPRCWFKPQE